MSLKKIATSGIVWTFAQQFGNQIIGFVVSLILARLLLPEEFGLIGMIGIFVGIGRTMMDSGLSQSLIRSEELDDEDYSTVFYFNLIGGVFSYVIIYFSAPLISKFYEEPLLTDLVRVYCITFIISAFSAVQASKLTKEFDFKLQTIISIPATFIGGIVGITLALLGFGVWSLVWSYTSTVIISSILLWYYSNWKPSWVFNISKFKEHFNFGYKMTISEILNILFKNIYIIIIGRFFSASQVGFYTRAETVKQLPVSNISVALNRVTFPLFASIQNDDFRLKRIYKKLMQMVVFVNTPVIIILAVLAEPVFRFLFTEKWLPAVPYFQILCFTGILSPIHSYNLNILKIKGRADIFLKIGIIKKVIILISVCIAFRFGIIALLITQVFTSIFEFFINSHYSGIFINYKALEQLRDVSPIIFLSLLTGGIVLALDQFTLVTTFSDIIRITIGVFLGFSVYFSLAWALKISSLKEIQSLVFKK